MSWKALNYDYCHYYIVCLFQADSLKAVLLSADLSDIPMQG